MKNYLITVGIFSCLLSLIGGFVLLASYFNLSPVNFVIILILLISIPASQNLKE